jgi:hypothetical protein
LLLRRRGFDKAHRSRSLQNENSCDLLPPNILRVFDNSGKDKVALSKRARKKTKMRTSMATPVIKEESETSVKSMKYEASNTGPVPSSDFVDPKLLMD